MASRAEGSAGKQVVHSQAKFMLVAGRGLSSTLWPLHRVLECPQERASRKPR